LKLDVLTGEAITVDASGECPSEGWS